jgi:hypothetical protein
MATPLASVVIPAYNQAAFLPATLHSVMRQTYPCFEVIVVNDASDDETDELMTHWRDPRLRYIVHERNERLSAARNTGIRAAHGALIFLLDADDLFDPDKLAAHVDFLAAHPEIGATYNARFELHHSSDVIRESWQPPNEVGLRDFVLCFPFSPSDMVIRREWLFRVGLFDPAVGTAEDTDLPCRLALAGCRFAGLNRALNYRRYHSRRTIKNLQGRLDDVKAVHKAVFADPRCPAEVRALGPKAIKHHLMVVAGLALKQDETALAQRFLRELTLLDPHTLEGAPCELMHYLASEAVSDDSLDHESVLRRMCDQFPPDLSHIRAQLAYSVAQGHLWKAIRNSFWGPESASVEHFDRARELGARLDAALLQHVTYHLLFFAMEQGEEEAWNLLLRLTPHLQSISRAGSRQMLASYLINRAFELYRVGEHLGVVVRVIDALRHDFRLAMNRGVVSILFHSLLKFPSHLLHSTV